MDTKDCIQKVRFDAYLLLYELRFKERVSRNEAVVPVLYDCIRGDDIDRRTDEETCQGTVDTASSYT